MERSHNFSPSSHSDIQVTVPGLEWHWFDFVFNHVHFRCDVNVRVIVIHVKNLITRVQRKLVVVECGHRGDSGHIQSESSNIKSRHITIAIDFYMKSEMFPGDDLIASKMSLGTRRSGQIVTAGNGISPTECCFFQKFCHNLLVQKPFRHWIEHKKEKLLIKKATPQSRRFLNIRRLQSTIQHFKLNRNYFSTLDEDFLLKNLNSWITEMSK